MGGLRQAAFRRTRAGVGLRRALYSSLELSRLKMSTLMLQVALNRYPTLAYSSAVAFDRTPLSSISARGTRRRRNSASPIAFRHAV